MRVRSLFVALAAALFVALGVQDAGATQDPYWVQQYGPTQIGAPTAWQKSTAKGVKVAVIDSGVDVDHPDLQKNLDRANSRDFACDDDNPDDDSLLNDASGQPAKGHGTHVTGIVAATTNNFVGIAGVAPDPQVMVLKVMPTNDSCGNLVTSLTEIPNAINHAVDRGAKVINLSLITLFGSGTVGTISTPCNNAFARGALCVIATGNSGETRGSGYEYNFNGILVTANDSTGRHASFGQKADTKWAVSAPGADILSTWPIDDASKNGYDSHYGTSMAAPHVTGAAALLFGAGMNARQVAETLVKTAGPARDSTVEGAGLIHVDRALGLETTATTSANKTGSGTGTVTRGGRAGAAGGKAAIAPTTTALPTGRTTVPGAAFEEGFEDVSELDAIRLQEASRNEANQPFNATVPLVIISALSAVALVAAAIPRLRSKDSVPLG